MKSIDGDQEPTADAAGRPLIAVGIDSLSIGALHLEAITDIVSRTGSLGSDALTPGSSSALDTASLLDLLDGLHALTNAIASVEIRAAAALGGAVRSDSAEHGESTATADKVSLREISIATRVSPSTAGRRLTACRRLVRDMPTTLHGLAIGAITPEKAYAAASRTSALDPAQRSEVDRGLGLRLEAASGMGQRQWEAEVTALMQLADPHGERRRHEVARRHRNITLHRRDHGMAALTLLVPAIDASLARKRLSLEGEKLRAAGDRRGHSSIMADTATDALIGRGRGIDPVTLDIGVILTDRALLCPDSSEPAIIEGYGAVPVDQISASLRSAITDPAGPDAGSPPAAGDATHDEDPAPPGSPRSREVIAGELRATLRRLYTHPTSGELVAVESRGRAFPPALSRFLRWRSMTCSGPFCTAEIRHDDHITPYSRGGATSLDNGNGLCALCNDKETQGVTARTQQGSGPRGEHRVQWETRYGSVVEVIHTPSELSALLPRTVDRGTRGSAPRPIISRSLCSEHRTALRRVDIVELPASTLVLNLRRVRDRRLRQGWRCVRVTDPRHDDHGAVSDDWMEPADGEEPADGVEPADDAPSENGAPPDGGDG